MGIHKPGSGKPLSLLIYMEIYESISSQICLMELASDYQLKSAKFARYLFISG